MDIAVTRHEKLRAEGKLDDLDESEEINACTIVVPIEVDGKTEEWLLLFKNETHNHPTEIEPFGGAATCLGGAIRDPLSGRAYVYQAMRVTVLPTRAYLWKILARQTAAAQNYYRRGSRLQLLRQPDWPGNRPCTGILSR